MEMQPRDFDFEEVMSEEQHDLLDATLASMGKRNIYPRGFDPKYIYNIHRYNIAGILQLVFDFGKCSAGIYNYILNYNNIQEKVVEHMLRKIPYALEKFTKQFKQYVEDGYVGENIFASDRDIMNATRKVLEDKLYKSGIFDEQILLICMNDDILLRKTFLEIIKEVKDKHHH